MLITYLGHAGFCVETESTIIIMDPWVSKYGAFDSAWFQYPKNQHMAEYVREILDTSPKEKYLYLSHEHKDHFDLPFLQSLKNRDFSLVLGNFHRSVVKSTLENLHYQSKKIYSLNDKEELVCKDGTSIRLFLIDAELECDSAILVKSKDKQFLSINDCKLHEFLSQITQLYGKINVFAAQFSGAIWHPTCYDYDKKTYEQVSINKRQVKFELTARAIETLKPDFYLPSAGPCCFLDPQLLSINFEKINIFPRARELVQFLDERCKNEPTLWPEIMPGDVLDVEKKEFITLSPIRTKDEDFVSYIKNYAQEYQDYFQARAVENQKVNPEQVFLNLAPDLQKKIDHLKLVNEEVSTPLYWKISNHEPLYKIDFTNKKLSVVKKIANLEQYYLIEAPAWQVNKVLTGEIDWPDFALTFRVKLSRKPDAYNTLIHGFLTLDSESIERFCELMHSYNQKLERMIIHYQGKRYSVLRYCRHQGADLSQGWFEKNCLVCPRHRWHYDITNKGKCTTNNLSIDAICLDEENPTGE